MLTVISITRSDRTFAFVEFCNDATHSSDRSPFQVVICTAVPKKFVPVTLLFIDDKVEHQPAYRVQGAFLALERRCDARNDTWCLVLEEINNQRREEQEGLFPGALLKKRRREKKGRFIFLFKWLTKG